MTRNFATLGPSELWPPITVVYTKKKYFLTFAIQFLAGVRPYTSSYDLAKSCVFIKQSLPPFILFLLIKKYINKNFLSRSYKVNLPSSFTMILFIVLVYSTHLPVLVFSTVSFKSFLNFFINSIFIYKKSPFK